MKHTQLLLAGFTTLNFALWGGTSFSQTIGIAGGTAHSLAICNDSTVRTWGWNLYGQLGNGSNSASNVPVQVSSLTGITAVAGGNACCFALKKDSTVWAWGWNIHGKLGNGTNTDSNIPVQVSSLMGIIAIAGGLDHSLALKKDGTVWAWGWGYNGELGNGTNTDSNVPVQVSSLTGIIAIAVGNHCLALKNDGTVWAWGSNAYGQLGNGSTTNSNVPVQVNSLSGMIAIAAGAGGHSLAIKNDGTVWAWGYNTYGELGNGTNTKSNVPVQVSSLTGIIAIAAGEWHSLALKNDSTVWAWGYNTYGELGNGTNTNSNIPVSVSSLAGITDIAAGEGGGLQSIALKNDGTVWTWGRTYYYGDLGNGSMIISNVPVQVTGLCQVLNGVDKITEPLAVSVYPNPSNGQFKIELELNSKAQIIICNVLGETIYKTQAQQGKQEIDISDFANGIYILKVFNNEQQQYVRIVKQ